MKPNILSSRTKAIRIYLLAFFALPLLSGSLKAQDTYSLQFSDTSTYDNSCGKVINSQWSVRLDSCILYTPFFRKETSGCFPVAYDIRINQSGNGDIADVAYVQFQINNGLWVTDTVLNASAYAAVHHLKGDYDLCYTEVIRYRIVLKTDSKSEFWAIMNNDLTLQGSFATYTSYPPPIGTLPVEITAFGLKCTATGSTLNWTTASETNNEFFTIEKSHDMLNWRIVTNISGAFNSNQSIDYESIDSDMVPDKLTYYRLKQTDTDGKYKYFDVLSILCSFRNDELQIIGLNVSDENVNLIVKTNGYSPVQAYLTDIAGRTITIKQFSPVKGSNIVKLDAEMLLDGIYVATIIQDGKAISKKIFLDTEQMTYNY